MTISISSLVIGCGLFFLAGAFTGVSIMCMLSVRKSRRLNANYFVSDSDTWRKKRQQRKETKVDICIRGINSNVVKALETSAKKHDLSREEYLRQCLERIAYDDRALGSKYEQQLQKLFQCLEGQQKQLSLLIVGMEQVEESCCRLEDGLLEKESWSEESEGAIV